MKDNKNLYNHNIWTATESDNELNDFVCSTTMNKTPTNQWSNIGEKSIKLTPTGTTDYCRIYLIESIINKTVTAKLNIKTKETISIRLREVNSNTLITSKQVTFTGCGELIISLYSSSENTQFYIQISDIPAGENVFIDNIRLNIS